MAARRGTVRVSITGDSSGLSRATRQAEGSFNRLERSGSQRMRKLADASKLAGAAIAGGLVIAGKVAVETATDTAESITKNQALFGRYAKTIDQFSRSTATSLGISRAKALEAAGTFGGLFDAIDIGEKQSAGMSKRLVQLAADLASFNNASPEEALEALRSGLSGEAEPMRRFNAFLSEGRVKAEAYKTGIAAVGSELTEKQKIQARYALILKDTNAAHGDFARTSGGLANQQRILKAQLNDTAGAIGGQLLPVLTRGASTLNSFITGMRAGTGAGGQFRAAVQNVAGAIAPMALGLGRAALEAVQVATAFLGTRAGVVALSAVLGGLAGRLVALGALWAVYRIQAFVAAVRTAIIAVRGLSLATAATGIGALAVVLGIVAGAVMGFSTSSANASSSVRDLTSAINAEQDALRELRDLDIASAQAKANYRTATVSVATAEARLNQLRRSGKTHTLEFRQAEADLAQAKVGQRRATRELADVEGNERRVRQRATEATQDRIAAGRKLVARLNDEIGGLRANADMLRKMGASADGSGNKSEKLRQILHKLKGKEGELRTAQRALNAEINRMPAKREIKIGVNIGAFIGSQAVGGTGDRTGSGLPLSLNEMTERAAREKVKDKFPPKRLAEMLFGGALGFGKAAGVDSFNPFASRYGLSVTSGFRPGDPGWHGVNRARDYGGATGAMLAFARFMSGTFGGRLKELIHTPLGFGIKNGKRVGLGFWGSAVNADHYDHVHVAYQRGGTIPGRGDGDKVPVLAEPGEGFINKRAVRALGGGRVIDAINRMVPRFASGGVVAKAAYAAGFRGPNLVRAVAEAGGESGWRERAVGDGGWSKGLMQIYTKVHPWARKLNLFDPYVNMRAAMRIFRSQGWGAWHGNHVPWIGRAKAAVASISGGGGAPAAKKGKKRHGVRSPEAKSRKRGELGLTKDEQGKLDRLDRALAIAEGTETPDDDMKILRAKAGLLFTGLRRLERNPKATGEQIRTSRSAIGELFTAAEALKPAPPEPVDTGGGDLGGVGAEEDPALKALQAQTAALEENNRRLQEMADLTKQQRDDALRARNVSQSQYGVLARAIADVASGTLGGRIGLGFQSPSYAGGVARY